MSSFSFEFDGKQLFGVISVYERSDKYSFVYISLGHRPTPALEKLLVKGPHIKTLRAKSKI